jgi:hypothetical protein
MVTFQFTVTVVTPKKVNGLLVTKDWVADVLESLILSDIAKAADEVENDPSDSGAALRHKMEVYIERGNQD